MRFEIACLFVVVAAVCAQAPSSPKNQEDGRFFFTTFTLVLSTTTSTATSTSTVTCTTSAAALSTCTAGRRRRGLFYNEGEKRNRRGLFYNDEEEETIFSNLQKRAAEPADKAAAKPAAAPAKSTEQIIPLNIQSGFSLPEDINGPGRFGLALGTSTRVTTSVVTSTQTLTATCASTTNYPTCGSGK